MYAFAVTLWEILSHQQPWMSDSDGPCDVHALSAMVASGARPGVSPEVEAEAQEFSPGWMAIMHNCWHQVRHMRQVLQGLIAVSNCVFPQEPLRRPSFQGVVDEVCGIREAMSGGDDTEQLSSFVHEQMAAVTGGLRSRISRVQSRRPSEREQLQGEQEVDSTVDSAYVLMTS